MIAARIKREIGDTSGGDRRPDVSQWQRRKRVPVVFFIIGRMSEPCKNTDNYCETDIQTMADEHRLSPFDFAAKNERRRGCLQASRQIRRTSMLLAATRVDC